MRKVILQMDGASDLPIDELDGKTPMEVARTPNLDRLASLGRVGRTTPAPYDMELGSDIANLSLLGYDPHKYYTGRAPIEAASMGVPVEGRDVAFRINLVTVDGEKMLDHSGGNLTTDEGRELIEYLSRRIFGGSDVRRIYPGVGYRHLMIWGDGPDNLNCTPPHNIVGQAFARFMPEGDKEQSIRRKMWDSYEVLLEHPVNQKRVDEGRLPANMIWPWGPGRMPSLPLFSSRHGCQGVMIAAVDLMKGLGKLVGLYTPDVPGATGYLETNYQGKAEYALRAMREGRDFAFIHLEGPDEAGHSGHLDEKIRAIERIDAETVAPLLDGLGEMGSFRFLCLPDHSTPVSLRRHDAYDVPFMLYDTQHERENSLPFDERGMRDATFVVPEGHRMIDLLFQ